MGEPPQSHYYVVYIAFTFRVRAFHTWASLCFFSSCCFPYVPDDELLFMTSCVVIPTLNRSPIEGDTR